MIRAGKIEDAEKISELKINNYKITYKNIILDKDLENMSLEEEKQKYLKGFEKRKILVYEENDNILGYIYYGKRKNNIDSLREIQGEVYAIYVDINQKNKGIGTKLIKQALNELINEYEKVILWCATDNINSKEFYKKRGFKESVIVESEMGEKFISETAFVYELKDTY
ncbi:MAG: GNAT family N-acetyltransferase [Clostridia bacterium]|nr:GNAT family N-acetyltransferase [Clostridia bacterium]